jgi:hypothetical protein
MVRVLCGRYSAYRSTALANDNGVFASENNGARNESRKAIWRRVKIVVIDMSAARRRAARAGNGSASDRRHQTCSFEVFCALSNCGVMALAAVTGGRWRLGERGEERGRRERKKWRRGDRQRGGRKA